MYYVCIIKNNPFLNFYVVMFIEDGPIKEGREWRIKYNREVYELHILPDSMTSITVSYTHLDVYKRQV